MTQVSYLSFFLSLSYLLERDDASLFAEMQQPGPKEVYDAIEVPRAPVEPELVLNRVVAVAVLHHLVHGSNLLETTQAGLRKLFHQCPRNLRIEQKQRFKTFKKIQRGS